MYYFSPVWDLDSIWCIDHKFVISVKVCKDLIIKNFSGGSTKLYNIQNSAISMFVLNKVYCILILQVNASSILHYFLIRPLFSFLAPLWPPRIIVQTN